MTSKQAMLMATVLATAGCAVLDRVVPAKPLTSPYATRRVWAVVPPTNQSGSTAADPLAIADQLVNQIERVENLHALPVNRVLAAMEAGQIQQVDSPAVAMTLMRVLGADGLIVGSISLCDPYDPPKLAMAMELYASEQTERYELVQLRYLSSAATAEQAYIQPPDIELDQPVSQVSAAFDASDPAVRAELEKYAAARGAERGDRDDWRRYRINMNLFREFVAAGMTRRLLEAEAQRLAQIASELEPEPAP